MISVNDALNLLIWHDTFVEKSRGLCTRRMMSSSQADEIAGLVNRQISALNVVNFCIKNNGCEGNISNNDYCLFCFMRPYCNNRAELLTEVPK